MIGSGIDFKSIDLATVTPSLVTSRSEINHGGFDFQAEGLLYPKTRTLGAPKDCSITTFRPSRRSLWTQQIPHSCFMTFSMGYSWWFAGILRWSQGNLMKILWILMVIGWDFMVILGSKSHIESSFWGGHHPQHPWTTALGPMVTATASASWLQPRPCLISCVYPENSRKIIPEKIARPLRKKSTVNIWLMIVNIHLVGGWPTPLKWWS